jgi:hypothetical protein
MRIAAIAIEAATKNWEFAIGDSASLVSEQIAES